MKFGLHHSSWLESPDPAEAYEAVKAKAQGAEEQGFVWFSVMDHMIQIPRVCLTLRDGRFARTAAGQEYLLTIITSVHFGFPKSSNLLEREAKNSSLQCRYSFNLHDYDYPIPSNRGSGPSPTTAIRGAT